MQQAVLSLPPHLTPGHPSFDQHAYQLLLQQQHHQAAQLQQIQQLQQQQPEQHHQQHHDAAVQAELHGEMEDAVHTPHEGQGPGTEHASDGQHDLRGEDLDLGSSAH